MNPFLIEEKFEKVISFNSNQRFNIYKISPLWLLNKLRDQTNQKLLFKLEWPKYLVGSGSFLLEKRQIYANEVSLGRYFLFDYIKTTYRDSVFSAFEISL